jgi:hypothetical protein
MLSELCKDDRIRWMKIAQIGVYYWQLICWLVSLAPFVRRTGQAASVEDSLTAVRIAISSQLISHPHCGSSGVPARTCSG